VGNAKKFVNLVYRGKFNIEVLELTFGLAGFYLVLRFIHLRFNGSHLYMETSSERMLRDVDLDNNSYIPLHGVSNLFYYT